MARELKEVVTCDVPKEEFGEHEGVVKAREVIIDGRLYEPDWCAGHLAAVKRMMGKVKPKPKARGTLHPVDPANIPRLSENASKTPR